MGEVFGVFDSHVICFKIVVHVANQICRNVALVHGVEIVTAFQILAVLVLFGLERLQELSGHVHVGLVAREAASADVVLVHVVARVDARLFSNRLALLDVRGVVLDHAASHCNFLPS